MPGSKAIAAIGTLLKSGDGGSPEVYQTLAEVLDITGPETTADELEVTNHTSTGAFKEWIPSLLDAGNVTFDLNFIQGDTSQRRLHQDYLNRTRRNYELIFPVDQDSTPIADRTIAFSAFVTRLSYTSPVAGVLRRSATLRIRTAPSFGFGT